VGASAELEVKVVAEFAAACDTELGEYRFEVILHGVRGDLQPGGDLPGAQPDKHAADYLALASGQAAGGGQEREEPRSTIDLAKSVGLSPGGVSQHLAVMRNAGLLDKHRVRREVLYWRSPAGDSLLAAAAPAD
jgi:DNA-binding transcriptional ArsR family regulator